MAHVVCQAKFSSRLPPFERLYVGSTDRPDLRPEQLADRSLGKQPKFLKPLVGSVQFEILHVKLTQPSAWLLEAKVAADLSFRYRSLCVRGAGWSQLTLTERHSSELEAVHSCTSLQQILALDYARDGGPLSQHLRGLSFKPPAGARGLEVWRFGGFGKQQESLGESGEVRGRGGERVGGVREIQ